MAVDGPGTRVPVVECVGVPVAAVTPAEAMAEVVRVASGPRRGLDVHLCNAYTLALADTDADLRALLRRAWRNYPDGKAVVWANRLRHRGAGLPADRVYGPDLFLDVLAAGRAAGLRHAFLGSTPEVLVALEAEVVRRFPGVVIAGTLSPAFRALTDAERAEQDGALAALRPDVVWVGLGTPKQDVEAARLAGVLPCVVIAVGAAFEFVAGTKRQAPAWLGRAGLEWAFRLATEPRRLWRRYLFGNVRFVRAALRRGGEPGGAPSGPD